MLKAYINGIEYAVTRDFVINEQLGNKGTTQIKVKVDEQPIPAAGDVITLESDGRVLFWGTCGIPRSPTYSGGREWRIYDIVCGDANSILSYRIINEAYQEYTISDIVGDLYNKYIAEEGVALEQISIIPFALKAYVAPDFNLQDALNELAEQVNAIWTIDNNRRFSFLVYDDFPVFPFVLTEDFFLGGSLQHTTKDYKMRTVQYISGATDTTSEQVESFVYDGETNKFTLSFGVSQRPSIAINGTPVSPSSIGVAGINDNDEGITFVFRYNSPTISYKTTSHALNVGDTVTVTYIGIYPVRVVMTNSAKIAEVAAKTGTSGKRELVTIAKNLRSSDDARELAASLLERFAEATGEVNFWLLSSELYGLGLELDDIKLLTKMRFDMPYYGITGDYVIVERTITPTIVDSKAPFEHNLRISLRLVNRDYLKSYGEILADLRKNVKSLAIRDDDIVVKGDRTIETVKYSEATLWERCNAYFATGNTVEHGSLFAPCDLGLPVYPIP